MKDERFVMKIPAFLGNYEICPPRPLKPLFKHNSIINYSQKKQRISNCILPQYNSIFLLSSIFIKTRIRKNPNKDTARDLQKAINSKMSFLFQYINKRTLKIKLKTPRSPFQALVIIRLRSKSDDISSNHINRKYYF